MTKVKKSPSKTGIKLFSYLNNWKRVHSKIEELFARKTHYTDEKQEKEIDKQISYFKDEQNVLFDMIQKAIGERKKEINK